MLNKYRLAALAIAASGLAAAAVPADKAVTCNAPVAYVITGSTAN